MNLRWLKTRTARKFFRQKMAVVSLGVILVYLAVAGAVGFFGLVTLEESEQRVGPNNVPGFFLNPEAERRLEDASILLETVERALDRENVEQSLDEIRFGKLEVAHKSPSELRAIVERGWAIFDELAAHSNLNDNPDLRPKLDELDAVTAELFRPLEGWDWWAYRLQLLLGTDRQGRSISMRAVYSTKVAIQIGAVTALISVLIGSLLGTAAAFFGGIVDHIVIWLYTTFSSIPNLVLLVLLAYMFTGGALEAFEDTLVPVYVAFCATFWIGPCRIIRGETLKLKELEYVQAATAIGFGRPYIMLKHILPNTAHLMLINFSLLFIGAIKSEVILSFLGLGVKKGPSWGIMISQAGAEVVTGFFWQIGAATAFMFVLVLAFNLLSDALQDVFDPKHV